MSSSVYNNAHNSNHLIRHIGSNGTIGKNFELWGFEITELKSSNAGKTKGNRFDSLELTSSKHQEFTVHLVSCLSRLLFGTWSLVKFKLFIRHGFFYRWSTVVIRILGGRRSLEAQLSFSKEIPLTIPVSVQFSLTQTLLGENNTNLSKWLSAHQHFYLSHLLQLMALDKCHQRNDLSKTPYKTDHLK